MHMLTDNIDNIDGSGVTDCSDNVQMHKRLVLMKGLNCEKYLGQLRTFGVQ
jgi:hypothetical protein